MTRPASRDPRAALLEAVADRIGATPRRPGDLELAAAVLLAHQILGAVPIVRWPPIPQPTHRSSP